MSVKILNYSTSCRHVRKKSKVQKAYQRRKVHNDYKIQIDKET